MFRFNLRKFVAKTPPFAYVPIFAHTEDKTEYRLITKDFVEVVKPGNSLPDILRVDVTGLTRLAEEGIRDISHLLRSSHLQSLRNILDDNEASENDRFVAYQFLKNAKIAAEGILPTCQDTGTAIISAIKGEQVFTHGSEIDEAALSRGVYNVYTGSNLRYSQNVPLSMFDEKNTGTNLPAQIDIYANKGMEYKFKFIAKGGGSANKSYLFQETKAVLNPKSFRKFLEEKLASIGTAACPPYHLAIVVGGTSAEQTLQTVKYASIRYYDGLPTVPDQGGYALRDPEMEKVALDITQKIGMGAQFGGKYFAHDVRVLRLPRHGASCPIAIGVSCSADRQALAKINKNGIWLEKLETNPAKYLPDIDENQLIKTPAIKVDLNQPMDKLRELLSKYPIKTRLSLSGTIVVARDIAHAKIKERLDRGEGLPDYFKNYVIYYAGPAKTPTGYASGSFGPTTAGRMDSFVDDFQAAGGSFVMLAKGNRSKQVTDACKKHRGFYLGSIGGPAAVLATESIKKVEVLDMAELGMEAVWKIDVKDFPAFIVVDDKGNDFFTQLK